MNRFLRIGVVVVLGVGFVSGCSKSSTSTADNAATSDGSGTPTIIETDPNNNPIAKAASEWLTAVLKGDTQRASAMLTPQAMQRIIASGKGFSPPGLETATFKIGEVRAPSADQAIVQCVLTDTSEAVPHSEEMCCLMRKVDNDWRVSGIAYGTAPDKPWTLTDFESGQNMAIPRPGQTMGGNVAQGSGANQPPVAPPAPLAAPVAGPSNVNSPAAGTAGLGMPAVGPAAGVQPQYQPQYQPYTAQEPQPSERR